MNARALSLVALVYVLLASAASPAEAQTPVDPGPARWTPVRIAKWALLGTAVGFAVYAVSHTSSAEERYGALNDICFNEPDRCTLEGGRYADPSVERLYDETARHDRQAQLGIIGAQTALFGSVALFIYDLRNDRGPDDIPYPSLSARSRPALGVGARIAF